MWKYGQSTSAVASAYSEPHLNDLLFIAVASEARKGLRENKTLEPFFFGRHQKLIIWSLSTKARSSAMCCNTHDAYVNINIFSAFVCHCVFSYISCFLVLLLYLASRIMPAVENLFNSFINSFIFSSALTLPRSGLW